MFGDLDGVEDHALTGSRDMSKHAMFDRIVLRAIRRIMGHAQLQSQAVGQSLQVFLEQVLRRTVASAAIAENQQTTGFRVGRPAILLPPCAMLSQHNSPYRG